MSQLVCDLPVAYRPESQPVGTSTKHFSPMQMFSRPTDEITALSFSVAPPKPSEAGVSTGMQHSSIGGGRLQDPDYRTDLFQDPFMGTGLSNATETDKPGKERAASMGGRLESRASFSDASVSEFVQFDARLSNFSTFGGGMGGSRSGFHSSPSPTLRLSSLTRAEQQTPQERYAASLIATGLTNLVFLDK